MSLGGVGQGALVDVKNFFEQPAEKYGNDSGIEMQWAIKAYQHAEVYFNLIKTVDPTSLKLTPIDSEIYSHFRECFKDVNVNVVDVDKMKSVEGKTAWREFCDQYKQRVEDFNMGSLLRIDASKESDEDNTFIVPRIQFLAIEIARNREGYNSCLREKFGVASAKSKDNNDSAPTEKSAPKEESS